MDKSDLLTINTILVWRDGEKVPWNSGLKVRVVDTLVNKRGHFVRLEALDDTALWWETVERALIHCDYD